MVLAPTTIVYASGVRHWLKRDEKRLRKSFEKSLLASISSGPGWVRVDEAGEGVLLVRTSLLDVDIDPTSNAGISQVVFSSSKRGPVIVLELFDSVTHEALFRFIQRRTLPSGVFSAGDVDRRRTAAVFREFTDDIGERLRSQYRIIRDINRLQALASRQ